MAALAQVPTGRHHDITGPQALDVDAIVDAAAEEWNSPMKYVDVSPAEFASGLAAEGVDAWWNYAYSSMFASVREHRWETVSDDVRALTCTEPGSLADVLGARQP